MGGEAASNLLDRLVHDELHIFAVGDAHIALRNLSFGGVQVSTNGSGNNGWLCQGTHHQSYTDGNEFHVVSTGHGDNKANRCERSSPPGTKMQSPDHKRTNAATARQEGAVAVLAKPAAYDHLLSTLRNAMTARSADNEQEPDFP